MNVLLINAPVARMSPHARLSPPLGIAYLGAYLRERGHTVELLDLNISGYSDQRIAAVMRRFRPGLAGISVHTETYGTALLCAARIKELSPETPVVFGGPHPSILPGEVLAEPHVDFVVAGEGEEPLAGLVEALETGSRAYAEIPGLGYTEDGEVKINERAAPGDPDRFPLPARDLLPLEFYASPFNVLTARGGCPYRCPFCSASFVWHGRHRQRSASAVIDELELLISRYGARHVFFGDDIFTLSHTWLDTFLAELERVKGRITWSCATRVDLVDQVMLEKMAQAGCTGIQYGIESGAQEILDSVKGISKDDARRAVKYAVSSGIRPSVSFMVPFPDDTEATLKETFDFIGELKEAGADPLLSYTSPFPGTLFYEHAEELGLSIFTRDWEQYDCKHVIMATRHLSAERIEKIVRTQAKRLGLSRSA